MGLWPWHINIWVGGPLLSLLWPPLSGYIPFAGGAALQSALGHPEGCMVQSSPIHVPLASNHSNSCQRVLLQISILNRKLSEPVQDPL